MEPGRSRLRGAMWAFHLALPLPALRRTDGRLYVVACAFLAGAGFLGLHALATPGVLLDGPNEGFALASPVGLAVAAVFAVASSLDFTPQRSAALLRHRNLLLGGLVALVLAWGADSLLGLPPLSAAPVLAVGESARAIETESGLLRAALARIGDGFGRDEVRIGLVTDGRLVFPADLGGAPPDTAAAQRALATKAPVETADGWVLPLLVKDNPAGVLAAGGTHGRYGERDRPVLASLASLLSVTLENARLYHQLDGLFRSYLSPDVAAALIADPAQAALGGAVVEVTALFADLRGFTTFSERSTPEQIVVLLNRYFDAATRCILAEGGTVVQFVGDALMALFNAPVRQPDHALRAGRAALAMQAAVGELAAHGSPLFRVGINTGPALVGNIGSDQLRNFNAMGDAVNVAARLESVAQPGQVVMGASTYAAIGPAGRVRPLGDLQVKGREQTVRAYQLLAIREVK